MTTTPTGQAAQTRVIPGKPPFLARMRYGALVPVVAPAQLEIIPVLRLKGARVVVAHHRIRLEIYLTAAQAYLAGMVEVLLQGQETLVEKIPARKHLRPQQHAVELEHANG